MKPMVIVDTDLGLDMDDAVALALLMASPEVHLCGVTTAFGDCIKQAQFIMEMMRVMQLSIPVIPGARQGLLTLRDTSLDYRATEGFLDPYLEWTDPGVNAGEFMIDMIRHYPGEITLLGIGPLTNIALALLREPSIDQHIREIVIMGGVHRTGGRGLGLPLVEYNIECDPEAAQIVLAARCPIRLITLDVTCETILTPAHARAIEESDFPLGSLLARLAYRWWDFIGREGSPLHDPLAAASLFMPELIAFVPAAVQIERRGRFTRGMTVVRQDEDSHIQVSVDVDSSAFMKFFLKRFVN